MDELQSIEYENIRVLTTQQIAEAYGTEPKVISNNFNRNKERYTEGKHFICLEGSELRDFKTNHQFEESSRINKLYLWTEKGAFLHAKSLNTDTAWEVYDRLVETYFRVKQIVSEELSPQMQLIMQMVNHMAEKELADKERDRQIALAKETASKAVETTERMREEIISPFENWRDDINRKVRQISKASGISYEGLFTSMYSDLEQIARCDLSTRQRNKRDRMEKAGCTKSDIKRETTKIAVIEDNARLKQIFEDIVRKYGMKYIA